MELKVYYQSQMHLYIEATNMIAFVASVIISIVLSLLMVLVVLHIIKVRNGSKYLKNIKGPKPNPIFGNMLHFAVPSYKIFEVTQKLLDEFGSNVIIYNGPLTRAVLITDVKLIEHILSSMKFIEKSEQYEHMYKWLGTGLLTSGGLKWKKRRRMITPSFHFSILENFVDVFENVGDVFVKKLEEHVDKPSFDIYPIISLCTLDVMCETSMGTPINALNNASSDYVRSVKNMCKILTDRNFSPLDRRFYPFTLNFYREQFALKVLHRHTDAVIDRRMKEFRVNSDQSSETNDCGIKKRMAFLDLLLRSTIDGKSLTREDIREEVDTFMFEGHDTTSSAIGFALYSLANNPLVQQKALEEQMEIFKDLKNTRATMADLQNMKYLELVIKETLRLYPSVPILGRRVKEEFEWENSIFPKDIQVILFAYGCQRSDKNYEKPLEFIPERFLDMDGTDPFKYIPFSAGPRNCIGQKFALLEMKSTISKVLRNFKLLPANPNPGLRLAPEIILVSKNGINVCLKKRF
ncbi:unnamed protein product [Phyllotreta striolata]|uniref:Cytochrome P450 n=1 Tax=Phyllotreta striolata TaxID=444603 RepID=A0A9N9XJC0_PHYSR|nr:unnamed protein product [Phyllotreta striolata]